MKYGYLRFDDEYVPINLSHPYVPPSECNELNGTSSWTEEKTHS